MIMERKMIDIETVKRRFGINDTKLRKIFHAMRKRHAADQWIITRRINKNHVIQYIKLEGYAWIESVYYRDSSEYYLDAEIRFTNKQIMRLEDELKYTEDWLTADTMSEKELTSYMNKSRASIKSAINQLSQSHCDWLEIKEKQVLITHDGIKWIIQTHYKKIYFHHLTLYKQKLQRLKEGGESCKMSVEKK